MATSLLRIGVILLLISLTSQDDDVSTPEMKLAQHMASVKKCMCGIPQARSFVSENIIRGGILSAESIMPPCTILHRCEDSGCCFGNFICGVKAEEEVELAFKIMNIVNKSDPHRIVLAMATNHTACSCQSKT